MPPAARITDPTTHGAPLAPGPGSMDVLIGGMPAWRALMDQHACPLVSITGPDGVGMVMMGSPTVFIDFMMACRMGDIVVEIPGLAMGPMNPIIMGCPTVMIGEMGIPAPSAAGMGGVAAGLAVSGATQVQVSASAAPPPAAASSTPSTPPATAPPSVSSLQNSQFNGVKADRVLPGTSDKVAVIGRSMAKAVEAYTQGLQQQCPVETFTADKISPAAQAEWKNLKKQYSPDPIPDDVVQKSQMFKENQAWAKKLVDQGYTVVDVDNPSNEKASPFYEMEKQTIFGDHGPAGAK
jgi:uncharacterized Zn-binding protein involved in type VI secretion